MEWIPISEIDNLSSQTLLFWQENLTDHDSSRFQRGVFYPGTISFVRIYPIDGQGVYKKDYDYRLLYTKLETK